MEGLATETAGKLALQGSGWACAVLLGLYCWLLTKRIDALHGQVVGLVTAVTATAESSKAAILMQASATERMQAAQTTGAQALQEHSHETANEIRELRHGIANHHAGVNAVVEMLARREQRPA